MLLIYPLKTLRNLDRFPDVFRVVSDGNRGTTAGCWVKVKFITYFVMLMKVVYWWAGVRVKSDCGVIV